MEESLSRGILEEQACSARKTALESMELAEELDRCIQNIKYSVFNTDELLSSPSSTSSPQQVWTTCAEDAKQEEIETYFSTHWSRLTSLKHKFIRSIQAAETECEESEQAKKAKVRDLEAYYHKQFRALEAEIESEKRTQHLQYRINELDRDAKVKQLTIELESLVRQADTISNSFRKQQGDAPQVAEVAQSEPRLGMCLAAAVLGLAVNLAVRWFVL
jgi:hypothetical protein